MNIVITNNLNHINQNSYNKSSLNNNGIDINNLEIPNSQLAHMIAQIRVKQLSCEQSQNKMRDNIIIHFEKNKMVNGSIESDNVRLTNLIKEKFTKFCIISEQIKEYLLEQHLPLVGYPNQRNRTHQQLRMAVEWIENEKDAYTLIEKFKRGEFLNGLSNKVDQKQLPKLESDHKMYFWGNENPSVTSLVLYGINKILGYNYEDSDNDFLVGCGKRVRFLREEFKFPSNMFELKDYPFADDRSMVLFGSYQFGGQRRFNEQYLFGPEDCSSSVGKASSLTPEQVRHFSTQQMIDAFKDSNNIYNFKPIVKLFKSCDEIDINKIKPGDIYLTFGHTGLFLTTPDFKNDNQALTIEFSRNLEYDTEMKVEGGGIRSIVFNEKIKSSEYYILRPNGKACSYTLENLIRIIDSNYNNLFKKELNSNITGDCSIFIQNSM